MSKAKPKIREHVEKLIAQLHEAALDSKSGYAEDLAAELKPHIRAFMQLNDALLDQVEDDEDQQLYEKLCASLEDRMIKEWTDYLAKVLQLP